MINLSFVISIISSQTGVDNVDGNRANHTCWNPGTTWIVHLGLLDKYYMISMVQIIYIGRRKIMYHNFRNKELGLVKQYLYAFFKKLIGQ